MCTSRQTLVPILLALTAAATTGAVAAGQAALPRNAAGALQPGTWRALFDGTSLDAWRGYQNAEIPAGWRIADGILRKDATTRDLMTKEQFGDFELEFEWKLGAGGNAGVFYRATEEYPRIYWSGPEYQLLDDANAPDGRRRLTSAGAAYGLYPAPAGIVKPADEWNASRIVAKGAHVEHWLNGSKLLEYDFGSDDWEARVKPSKFGAWPNYGRAKRGHIGIQGDHNGPLALRNIRIRDLP